MASVVTDKNYILIQGWMLNSFPHLTFQELGVYALVYGFSQDGESEYNCGLQYVADWCRLSRKDVAKRIMDRLVDGGYITRREFTFNGVVFVNYKAYVPDNQKCKISPKVEISTESGDFHQGCTNNKIDINKENINPTPLSPKGKSHKVLDLSFVDREDFIPIMEEWLAYKKEKGQTYKPTGLRTCYKKLVEYSNGNAEKAKQIIEEAMSNNYSGFFPLKQQSNGNNNRSNIQYGNPLYQGIVAEMERELGPLNF